MTTPTGSTPTLALGVSAPGATEIERLAGYVKSLTTDLEVLKAAANGPSTGLGSGMTGDLDKLTAAVTRMRREAAVAIQGIRTDIAGAFKGASKAVDEGVEEVAQTSRKAAAKLRVIGQSLNAEGGIKYSISGSGLGSVQGVKELQDAISKRPEVLAQQVRKLEDDLAKASVSLEKSTAKLMTAAAIPAYVPAGPAWWEAVEADRLAGLAKLEADALREEGLLAKQVEKMMGAATRPAYLNAGPKWWETIIAEQEAAQAALEADYVKSVTVLEKQVGRVMKAATQPAYLNAGPKWWEEVLAEQAAAQAALDAAYNKSVLALEKNVAKVMRAATEPAYLNAGPKWWEETLAELEAGKNAVIAKEVEIQTALAKNQFKLPMSSVTGSSYGTTYNLNGGIKGVTQSVADLEAAAAKADAKFVTLTARAQALALIRARLQQDSGKVSDDDIRKSFGDIAAKAAAAAPSVNVLQDSLSKLRQETKGAHGAVVDLGSGMRITTGALRELGVGVGELAGGNIGRLRQTFFSFLNQMGVLRGLVGAVLSPLGLAAIALVGLGVAAYKGEQQVREFNNTVQMTGGYAGITRGQFDEMARSLSGKTFTSIGSARDALMELMKTGRFTGDAMGVLGQAALSQSRITGEALSAIAKDYAKMPDGVYKWAEEHNKSMHFMSTAQLEHIRLLELQGKGEQAVIEVGTRLNEHMGKERENLGTLEKAWRSFANAISSAKEALLSIGKDPTTEQRLAAARDKLAKDLGGQRTATFAGTGVTQATIDQDRELVRTLEKTKTAQEGWAQQVSDTAVANEKASAATDRLAASALKFNKIAQERNELEKLHRDIVEHNAKAKPGSVFNLVDDRDGYITPAIQKQFENEIHQRYNGTKSVMDGTRQLIQAEYQAELKDITTNYSTRKSLLDEQYRNQLISEGTYYAQSLQNRKQYEGQLYTDFEQEQNKQYVEAAKEIAALGPKNLGSDEKVRQTQAIMARVDAWNERALANVQAIVAKASTVNDVIVDNYSGKLEKFKKSSEEYWGRVDQGIAKEAALAKARHDLADASDEVRARFEAGIKVEESHREKVEEIRHEYEKSAKVIADFVTDVAAGNITLTDEEQARFGRLIAVMSGYKDTLDQVQSRIDRMKGTAGDSAVLELQYKRDEEIRAQAKKMGETVTGKLADAILAGGKTGFKGMLDWAKDYLLKQPLKLVLQGVLQPIGTAAANAATSFLGLGTAGGSTNSLLSGLGTGSSLYNTLSNSSAGSSVLSFLGMGGGSGIAGAPITSAETIATQNATQAMLMDAGGGELAAPGMFAETTEAATQLAGTMGASATALSGLMSTIGTAMPYIGIALVAAQALGVFKHGGPKDQSTTGGDAGGAGASSGANTIAQAVQQQYTQYAALLGVNDTTLRNLSVSYAKDPQGTAQSQLQVIGGNYARSDFNGGKVENAGRSDDDFNQAIALASAQLVLKNLQEQVKGPVGDWLKAFDITSMSLDDLNKALETAKNVGGLAVVINAFGEAFANLKSLSVETTDSLVKTAGGLDKLTTNLQNYYTNFYTADEQKAFGAQAVADKLNGAGTTSYTAQGILGMSRSDFRTLVESAGTAESLATDAGQKFYTTLLDVANAFVQIHPDAAAVTSDLTKFRTAVNDLPMAKIAGLSDTAATEMIGFATSVDDLIANLQGYVKNFLSPEDQRNQITSNISRTLAGAGLSISADLIGQMTRDQFSAIVNAVDVSTSTGLKLHDALMSVQDAFASITPEADHGAAALQTTVDNLQSTIDKFKDFGKALRDFRDSLLTGDLSPLTPGDKYAQASSDFNSTYSAAMGGDADAMGKLQNVAQTFLSTSRDYNASNSQYTTDFAKVQTALTLAATQSDSITTTATDQLKTAQDSLTQLTQINSGVTGLSADMASTLTYITGVVSKMSGLSYTAAPSTFTSQVTDLYQSLLGRTPDSGGLTYWTSLMSQGMTLDQVMASIENSPEYKALPHHVLGGLGRGLSVVGEHGPELVDFKTPGRVYTAAQTSGMFGSNDVVASRMEALLAEMKALREQQAAAARAQIGALYDSTDKAADKIVDSGDDTANRAAWSERQKVTLE